MTQEEGALLWSTESEFDVEFDCVDCKVEDVDSVVWGVGQSLPRKFLII